MWQEQLISMVEGNGFDPDHIADLLVTYEAETGDKSLRGCGEVLMFMGALRPWPAFGFGFRSRSRYGSRSGSGFRSWSLTGYWSRSKSRSRSRSWSGFVSGFGSRSWSGSRSRSLSRSK